MFDSSDVSAPLVVHQADRAEAAERVEVGETFSERSTLGDDFELIPTPGHTPGATAYLWRHNGHRYLFTGDTLYLSDGEWVAGVLASSDREAYLASLELIGELDFDVIVPWAARAASPRWDPRIQPTGGAGSRRSSIVSAAEGTAEPVGAFTQIDAIEVSGREFEATKKFRDVPTPDDRAAGPAS